ncbi:MAG: lamin tail domain-containing protein [Bacteroidales bacterium]|nr:lamin tail domain-containing protein [Candidatus Colimorpha onthohippi]
MLLLVVLLFHISLSAQVPALQISEILFNPIDDGADFVEVYNNGSTPILTDTIRMARVSKNVITKLYNLGNGIVIPPHQYMVFTTDAADIMARYHVANPGMLIETAALPALNNASGTVLITTADTTPIDRLDYTESMHAALLRDVEGVSLERRSFERPTQEASNWYSAASTVGYATPTAANSQSHETLFTQDRFAISSHIISPDNDGVDDILDISYQLSDPDLSATITVLDAAGRMVRMLLRNGLLGGQGVITWDGTDNDRQRCPRGNYILLVQVYNTRGEQQAFKQVITLLTR